MPSAGPNKSERRWRKRTPAAGPRQRRRRKKKSPPRSWRHLRRRYTFDPNYASRAVNYLIQGTAAYVMKNGLINVWNMLRDAGWRKKGVRLLLTVHDELIIEVPYKMHSIELMRDVIWAMQMDSDRLGLPVRLPVEMKIAKTRWSRPTKIKLPHTIVGGAKKAA